MKQEGCLYYFPAFYRTVKDAHCMTRGYFPCTMPVLTPLNQIVELMKKHSFIPRAIQYFIWFGFVASVMLFPLFSLGQSKVAVKFNERKIFQRMEGFGAFNTLSFWKGKPDADKYSLIVNDLGLTMMRLNCHQPFNLKRIVLTILMARSLVVLTCNTISEM